MAPVRPIQGPASRAARLGIFPFSSPRDIQPSDGPQDGEWAKVLENLVKILTGHSPMRFLPFHILKSEGERASKTLRRWRTILGLEQIQYLPEDIDDPDKRVSLGLASHEIWHALFSRPELIFDEPELIKSMAFQALWWAVEDPRVNQSGLERHEGAEAWLSAVYARDYAVKDLAAERRRWAQLPLHLQFNYALIYEWAATRFKWRDSRDPRVTDPRVARALDRARGAIHRAINARSAGESFRIIRDEIWPVYRELADQAYEQAASEQGSGELESVKKRMEEAEREFRDKHASRMAEKPEEMSSEARRKAKQELETLRRKMGQSGEGQQEEQGEQGEAQAGEGSGQGGERERSAEEKRIQSERLSRPDERKKNPSAQDNADYRKYYDRVKAHVPVMRAQFLQELRRKIRRRAIRGRDSGDLDGDALSRIPAGQRDVFKEEMIANRALYRISLLIDTSGSMDGDKKERSIEGAVLLMESLEGVPGVLYEIVVFDSQPRVVKAYHEPATPQVKASVVSSILKGSGSTESHKALEQAIERLRMGRGEKLVIMVNDGDPDYNFDRDRYRAMISAAKNMEIHGVGLGPGAQLVEDLFPRGRGWWLKNAADFAKNLRAILRKKLLGS